MLLAHLRDECYREQQAGPFPRSNRLMARMPLASGQGWRTARLCGEKAPPAAPDNTFFKTKKDAQMSAFFVSSMQYYAITFATTPAPTVRPPSRIAKRKPSSIAIGAINSTTNFKLSPGITISTPSGSSTAPVTSVVRK